MFGEISSALTVAEKVGGYLKLIVNKNKPQQNSDQIQTFQSITNRFVSLFERHHVHRNQIPRFFGHDLTIEDVNLEPKLLRKLNDKMIADACKLFQVRREWLEGVDGTIYRAHDFYLAIDECNKFVSSLHANYENRHIFGRLIWEQEDHDGSPAVLVISEPVAKLECRTIFRHYICNNFYPSYFKSRAYLTACISIFSENGIHIRGFRVRPDELGRLHDGLVFVDEDLYSRVRVVGEPWFPEDMAIDPEAYVRGVEPYKKNSGIKSAVDYWIKMVESGELKTREAQLSLPRFKEYLLKI